MLTESDIIGAVYATLKGSLLFSADNGLNGDLYRRDGKRRPRGSQKEDAEIIFTAGMPGDIQEGVVTILVWVPDIDANGDGTTEPDGMRLAEVERLAQQWVEGLKAGTTGSYLWRLASAIATDEEPSIRQHFVSIRLRYRYGDH